MWILIIVLSGTFGGVIDSVEFTNKKSCELAAKHYNKTRTAAFKDVACFKK